MLREKKKKPWAEQNWNYVPSLRKTGFSWCHCLLLECCCVAVFLWKFLLCNRDQPILIQIIFIHQCPITDMLNQFLCDFCFFTQYLDDQLTTNIKKIISITNVLLMILLWFYKKARNYSRWNGSEVKSMVHKIIITSYLCYYIYTKFCNLNGLKFIFSFVLGYI